MAPAGYSFAEACAMLGISAHTLRRRIQAGEIQAERVERPQEYQWRDFLTPVPAEQTSQVVTTDEPAATWQHQPAGASTHVADGQQLALGADLERIRALETIVHNLTESIGPQSDSEWSLVETTQQVVGDPKRPALVALLERESIPALEPAPRLELCARCGSRVCHSTVACAAWALAIQLVPSHPVVDVSALRTTQPPCWPWPLAPESHPTRQHKSTAARI